MINSRRSHTIRILFVVNKLERRGAEQQLFSFVKALPNHIDVSIFRFSDSETEFPQFLGNDRVKIYSNKYSGTYNLLRFRPLSRCFSRKKYDIIITLGLGAALFFGRICAFLYGTKMVYSFLNTVENFYSLPKLRSDYFDVFNKGINKLIERLAKKRIYRFLPNSNKLHGKIKLAVGKYPVEPLPNGLPREEFENLLRYKPNQDMKSLCYQFEGYPTVTQVGALDENKNQIFTLRCIKEIKGLIPDIRFLIIGAGFKKAELVRWTLSNNLEKQVIFAGQMSRMECLYLISKATLLVLTSESESFPNVLLEGQALSRPVVTFDVGSASEIVKHGVTGYVIRKGDELTFKKLMGELLKDHDLARTMGEAGQQRVFDLFGMEKKVAKFLLMIKKDLLTIGGKL